MKPPPLSERFLEPPGFAWGTLTASDGALLRWGRLAAAQPRAEALLVGGFSEFIEKYFETMRDLAARGVSVTALDWRGQGGSARPRRLSERPRRRNLDQDVADLALAARTHLPGKLKRVLIAHSMGGALVLHALARQPDLADAAVLSAPMVSVETRPVSLATARLIARVIALTGFGAMFLPGARHWRPGIDVVPARSRVSNDPHRCRVQAVWFATRPELRVAAPTYAWLDSALRLTRLLSDPALLKRITTPVLIGAPGRDVFVAPDALRRLPTSLGNATLVDLPDAKHELFMERDEIRKPWMEAIMSFIDRHG